MATNMRHFPVLTTQGMTLIDQVVTNGAQLELSTIQVGAGAYSEREQTVDNLKSKTQLKSSKNAYWISGVTVDSKANPPRITAKALISNKINGQSVVSSGYRIMEVGLFGRIKGSTDGFKLIAIDIVGDHTDPIKNDYIPVYDGSEHNQVVNIVYEFSLAFSGADTTEVEFSESSFYLAEDGAALEEQVAALEENKVGTVKPLLYIDTQAAASTVDGQLTAALTALGWLNDVIVS